MIKSPETVNFNNISSAASNAALAARNASDAAKQAADAAKQASDNAAIAAKAAADSATNIAIVATDTSWMKKSLTGIEDKLEQMDKNYVTAAQFMEFCNTQSDHEIRLRRLETNMGKWIGAISVIVFVVTLLGGYLVKFIK